jgi:hypothetical protein
MKRTKPFHSQFKNTQATVVIDKKLLANIKQRAEKANISTSALMIRYIKKGMKAK